MNFSWLCDYKILGKLLGLLDAWPFHSIDCIWSLTLRCMTCRPKYLWYTSDGSITHSPNVRPYSLPFLLSRWQDSLHAYIPNMANTATRLNVANVFIFIFWLDMVYARRFYLSSFYFWLIAYQTQRPTSLIMLSYILGGNLLANINLSIWYLILKGLCIFCSWCLWCEGAYRESRFMVLSSLR